MKKSKNQLTPELLAQIVASIRSGGYGHVAAEAWGIPQAEFERWLARGESKGAQPPFSTLAAEVRAARAQARLRAETALLHDDARCWLEHGPGRETEDSLGWSMAVKAAVPEARSNPLLQPNLLELLLALLEALGPYPEARAQAAQVLIDKKVSDPKLRRHLGTAADQNKPITDGDNHGLPEPSPGQ